MSHIYILSNPAFELNVLKIGYTGKSAGARADELYTNNTSVPEEFKVEYEAWVNDPQKVEYLVHQALDEYRINKKREFFSISRTKARETIRAIAKKHDELKGEKTYFNIVEDIVLKINSYKLDGRKVVCQFLTDGIVVYADEIESGISKNRFYELESGEYALGTLLGGKFVPFDKDQPYLSTISDFGSGTRRTTLNAEILEQVRRKRFKELELAVAERQRLLKEHKEKQETKEREINEARKRWNKHVRNFIPSKKNKVIQEQEGLDSFFIIIFIIITLVVFAIS
jgi:hypothetical protein